MGKVGFLSSGYGKHCFEDALGQEALIKKFAEQMLREARRLVDYYDRIEIDGINLRLIGRCKLRTSMNITRVRCTPLMSATIRVDLLK